MAQTTWATAADVQDVTGMSVSEQQVTIAGFIIDNYTGRPYSFTWTDDQNQLQTFEWWKNVGGVDRYYLKLAVSYQTVWMLNQPDIMARMDVRSIPTTRESLQVAENAMVLGPITKKALGRVSWLRSRSLHVRSPMEDIATIGPVNFGELDFPWYPIGGYGPGYVGGDEYD
jgi:hypothetical protein